MLAFLSVLIVVLSFVMMNFNKSKIIAVDLDGTLTFTDTLHESLIQLLRDRPYYLFLLPIWLLKGKGF